MLLALFTTKMASQMVMIEYYLESEINVPPWLNVAAGKFDKKNKHSPFYTLFFYLPNFPGAMFIQGGTFISDSRVLTIYSVWLQPKLWLQHTQISVITILSTYIVISKTETNNFQNGNRYTQGWQWFHYPRRIERKNSEITCQSIGGLP